MKQVLLLILTLFITLSITTSANAAQIPQVSADSDKFTSTEFFQDSDFFIECTLTVQDPTASDIQLFAASKTKKAEKKYTIKNASGNVLATYTLTGNFSYDGSTSKCTSANYSTSISNKAWSFSSKSASTSGNKALGSFTATSSVSTISKSLSITCSKSGSIS